MTVGLKLIGDYIVSSKLILSLIEPTQFINMFLFSIIATCTIITVGLAVVPIISILSENGSRE